MRHLVFIHSAILMCFVLSACPKKEAKTDKKKNTEVKTPKKVVKKTTDPALVDIPFDDKAKDDPAKFPKKPSVEPIESVVRSILVSYAGAEGTKSSRSKKAAKKRAEYIAAAARKVGADFEALAKKVSDEKTESRDKPCSYHRGPMEADTTILDAALALGVGQVSDPVETKEGYWILDRIEPEEYSTAHILIQFAGAKLTKPAMKRKKADAQKFAEKLAKQAKTGKEPFFVIAGRHSDSPSKTRGGVIAPIRPGELIPGFEPYLEAVKKLKDNEVSGVVETPYGFHILKRLPLKKIMVRHILIRYTGADKDPPEKRRKADALKLATKLESELKKNPENFEKVAKEKSEDASSSAGGLMPPFARGQMLPRFEQFAFALKVGQVSNVVETKFGYHIIKREK